MSDTWEMQLAGFLRPPTMLSRERKRRLNHDRRISSAGQEPHQTLCRRGSHTESWNTDGGCGLPDSAPPILGQVQGFLPPLYRARLSRRESAPRVPSCGLLLPGDCFGCFLPLLAFRRPRGFFPGGEGSEPKPPQTRMIASSETPSTARALAPQRRSGITASWRLIPCCRCSPSPG